MKNFLIRLISIYMALTEPIKSDHQVDTETYEAIFRSLLGEFDPEMDD